MGLVFEDRLDRLNGLGFWLTFDTSTFDHFIEFDQKNLYFLQGIIDHMNNKISSSKTEDLEQNKDPSTTISAVNAMFKSKLDKSSSSNGFFKVPS